MTTPSGITELKQYRYSYTTPKGHTVSGVINAEDEVDAGIRLDFITLNDPHMECPDDWMKVVAKAKLYETQSTEDIELVKGFEETMLILFLIGCCTVLFAVAKFIFDLFGRADGM